MTLSNLLSLARKNLGGEMESSARLCLADAVALKDAGEFCSAIDNAIRSLRYSVGVFHPDYIRAKDCERGAPRMKHGGGNYYDFGVIGA